MIASCAIALLLASASAPAGTPADPPILIAEPPREVVGGALPFVEIPEGTCEIPPRMVWVFVDRWKEFGGWVIRETASEITVDDETETRTFSKAQVHSVVELAPPKPGQEGAIQLRDGSVVKGEILRDDLIGVGFKIDGMVGKISRSQVYRVYLEPDFEERYLELKNSTAPEEHGRRYAICQWLIQRQRLDLAENELQELVRDSDSDEARDLLRSVRAQMKFAKEVAEDKANPIGKPGDAPGTYGKPGDGPTSPGPPNPRELLPTDLLTDDEVNLIRVYEMDLDDTPRIRVPPEGVRQLILRYGSSTMLPSTTPDRNALYGKEGVEIARLMFDLKARDLYRYIEVQEDPASLAKFRTRVHNSWMLPNCATSQCHGGVQAGKFFLYTGNAKDARIRYTNMMTLLNFSVDGKPVVNFAAPNDSLLVQYAMPRTMARFPHPDVRGWKPVFSQGTPQLLEDTTEWIRSMYQPRPEYPVNYKAPALNAPDKPDRSLEAPDR